MTGDELAAALYAEQGYLVIGAFDECPIGKINQATSMTTGDCATPMRIVAVSTRDEFIKQRKIVSRLTGITGTGWAGFSHYYRIEAAD
jgi:hypothetical protein